MELTMAPLVCCAGVPETAAAWPPTRTTGTLLASTPAPAVVSLVLKVMVATEPACAVLDERALVRVALGPAEITGAALSTEKNALFVAVLWFEARSARVTVSV